MSSTEEHAAAIAAPIREALVKSFDVRGNSGIHPSDYAKLDALDALVARLNEAERERLEIAGTLGRKANRLAEVARERDAAQARVVELERALGAIQANAEAWHGNGEEGPRRALKVIAGWAADPSSVPAALAEPREETPGPPTTEPPGDET